MSKSQILITNKKVIEFFNKYPSIDPNDTMIYLINMMETLITTNNNTETQFINIQNAIERIKNDILDDNKKKENNIINKNSNIISDIKDTFSNVNTKLELSLNKKMDMVYGSIIKDFHDIKNLLPTTDKLTEEIKKELNITDKNNTQIKLIENIIDNNNKLFYEKISHYIDKSQDKLSINVDELKTISTNIIDLTNNTNNKLEDHLDKYNNSSIKGNIGENYLFNVLNDILPSAEITNTSKLSNSGDFLINHKKNKILIETKDYKTNVCKKEVDKFYRDIEINNCSGIFISNSSGIAKKDDFLIEIINNNVVIFLHNVNYNHDKIKLAINAITYLNNINNQINKSDIKISNEILSLISIEISHVLVEKNNLILELRKYYNTTLKKYNNIKFDNTQLFLSKYLDSTKIEFYICRCCKEYKSQSKRSLARHEQACRKKHNLTDESTEESTEDSIDNNSQNINV